MNLSSGEESRGRPNRPRTADPGQLAGSRVLVGGANRPALDYAHRLGVLHRDVKPANILVTAEGSPKLADFNISFSDKVAGATPAAYFGGSLAYMSPEQLEACHPSHARRPEELDGRSDLYSLGIVLWELLTGARPFPDEAVEGGWSRTVETMIERRRVPIVPWETSHVPGSPQGLPPLLETSLAADSCNRWSSGLEMARRLELCTNPKACALLFPPKRSLRVWLRRYTVLIVFVASGLPNVLAGASITFTMCPKSSRNSGTWNRIFSGRKPSSTASPIRWDPALFWYLGFSVYRGMRRLQAGELPPERGSLLRRRCLELGRLVALISVVEWSIAACVYPISLRVVHAEMPASAMLRFFFSLLLCGLVASAYPFFSSRFFRCDRSTLCSCSRISRERRSMRRARQIGRWNAVYLVVAALAPFLAIAALIADSAINDDVLPPGAEASMAVFSAVGLLGLPWLFWLSNSIRTDLATLASLVTSDDRAA